MIGPVSAYGAPGFDFASYAASRSGAARETAADRQTIEPQSAAADQERTAAAGQERSAQPAAAHASGVELPQVREGADAAEMSVRMRIEYLSEEQVSALTKRDKNVQNTLPGRDKGDIFPIVKPMAITREAVVALQPGEQQAQEVPGAAESESAQEVMEEGECQTCSNRKYKDGSDDPGVSFKTATKLSPEQAATAVRGHEMEHVVREQAAAAREGREVVSQNVTIHTDICPECGDVYVSGGTTETTTAEKQEPKLPQQAAGQEEGQKGILPGVA